ncbi:hypothetical protein GCM10022237_08180 [Nocardioides ginsengisoli]|uniref:DUF4157 domain-containing protein n=1 Tax=Nocardioides ginsengisoli TaxID=363868 RepID=A0ABW3W1X5_9ACTN
MRPLDRAAAEREADEAAHRLRARRTPAAVLRDGPVPEAVRAPVEELTGADLSHVRFDTHTDPYTVAGPDGLVAATDGDTVYTGLTHAIGDSPLAGQVVAHELVHTAQLSQAPGGRRPTHGVAPLKLGFCGGGSKDRFALLRSGNPLTAADAKSIVSAYGKLGEADRDKVVAEFHKTGDAHSGIQRLLAALSPADLEASRDLVSDLQDRVQRLAVEARAGKSLAQLGADEGAAMKKEAEAAALAQAQADAAAKGLPPPATVGAGDVSKAHDEETKKTSPIPATVVNAWDALSAADQSSWNARAAAVIAKVVTACNKLAPDLKVTAANLTWAPREVAAFGANVYAFSGDPISFGMSFVETAESDPEYVVRTVVHELAGHPSFVKRYQSAEAVIYAEAHKAEPSLGAPWDTSEEKNTFGYIGTEIYAALREVPFEKPLSAADAAKGLVTGITPADNIDNKISLVKTKFTLPTGIAIVQGLYERFRIDPRVTSAALALFVTKVEKYFGKVLKT